MLGYDEISQADNSKETGIDSLLERASVEARRILRSIQALAGTTTCKGVQIAGLRKWAVANDCWYECPQVFGVFSDRGSENEVYLNVENELVYKLNDFRYSDDNLTQFFERIRIHNAIFPDCAYTFAGFSLNADRNVCAVISQNFIRSDREASIEEIAGALALMGFFPQMDGEYFSNGEIDIFDALPNNVLHGIDGQLYFIDTICLPASDDFIESYKSLSPNRK